DRELKDCKPFNPSGLMIAQSVKLGTKLKESWFKTPELVKRGDLLSIIKSVGNLNVMDRAEALEDGCAGDIIRVKNIKSNRIVRARVHNGSTVTAL
ncbi:MAG: flagellar basal body P-ring formation chaperone FlgA, partial [Candidatus Wallbacteria bacterium]|nr:flagellar basal body P-ring formation chaperone FlgA [Candidatus Wallbacteria bacterium]